jgi:amino-acid N-acetyltransferase
MSIFKLLAVVWFLYFAGACVRAFPRPNHPSFQRALSTRQGAYGALREQSGLDRELRGDISYLTLLAPQHDKRLKKNEASDFEFTSENLTDRDFGDIFRTCAPYIARHRAEECVIHIPGHIIKDPDLLDEVMTDVSILHLLGVHLVLVMGVKDQLETRMTAAGLELRKHMGIRVTDEQTLALLKESCGLARCEIERSLTRAFSGQQRINVVSGNSFYSAKPIGVRDGVNFLNAGEVRKVESDNIKKRLQDSDIILLSPVGYSNSGETFSVTSENLAASVASSIGATKVVFYSEGETLIDRRTKKKVASLRLKQASELISSLSTAGSNNNAFTNDVSFNAVKPGEGDGSIREIAFGARLGEAGAGDDTPLREREMVFTMGDEGDDGTGTDSGIGIGERYDRWVHNHIKLLARCVFALNGGVERAHVISPSSGSLVKELYSRDGSGILISRDVYEGVRNAEAGDVAMIEDILGPLVEQKIMVPRSRAQLEDELSDMFVLTRDGTILACGMLKIHPGQPNSTPHGEICCIAVHPKYRGEGRGETILAYLERRALSLGVKSVFLLSTRTMGWFQERGYKLASHEELPPSKRDTYDPARNSQVYTKSLNTVRELDSEELMWRI